MTPLLPELRARHFSVAPFLFAAVFFLRLLILVRLTESTFLLPHGGDMQFYNDWALRILRGHWTTHTAFYGLPLYAYLLAGIYKLTGYNPFVPGLLQACVDAGTAVLIYKIGIRVFANDDESEEKHSGLSRGKVIGIIGATGWALFQPAEAYAVVLMPTSWMIFVCWFVVWTVVRQVTYPTRLYLFSLGILIGFVAMGVATVLIYTLLLVSAVIFKFSANSSARVTSIAVILAGLLTGTSPAWIHNYFVAHDRVFLSAHVGVNFWIGNNPTANGYPMFPPGLRSSQKAMLDDSITTAERVAGHPLKRSQVSNYWSSKASDWIAREPGKWLQLLGRKVTNFWSGFQYDDLSLITTFRERSLILPGLSFGFVAAFGLAGMAIALFRVRISRWIAGAVILQMLSLLSVFITERYRLAAVPGLLLFAGYALWELWHGLSRASLREVSPLLVSLAATTCFVSLPQKDSTLWALDNYNSGLQAYDAGDLSLAHHKLDLAYSYSPFNSEINLAEGNLRLAENDKNAAERFYFSSLRLDSHNQGSYNNLGVIALSESRWEAAMTLFSDALELSPTDAKTRYLLARACYGGGKIAEARIEIARALALAPAQAEFARFQRQLQTAAN